MSPEIAIRTSKPEDAPALRAAIDSVARERRFISLLEAPTVENVSSFIGAPNVASVVALSGDAVIGWAMSSGWIVLGLLIAGCLAWVSWPAIDAEA